MADTPAAPAAPETPAAGAPAAPPATPTPPTPEQIRAEVLSEVAAQLKAATGHDSIEALKAAQAKAKADKLAEDGQYKTLAEQAQAELNRVKGAYEAERIRGTLYAAAAESVDPDTVHALLSGQAKVGADGVVTIGGKPAAEAVATLLAAKPYLAKAAGGQGSGSGGASASGAKSVTRSAFERMDAAGRMAHVRAGGTVTEG